MITGIEKLATRLPQNATVSFPLHVTFPQKNKQVYTKVNLVQYVIKFWYVMTVARTVLAFVVGAKLIITLKW